MSAELVRLAERHGGVVENRSIRIPAARLAAFLTDAQARRAEVLYVECLYVSAPGTEPSLALSAVASQFETWDEFARFAKRAAEDAEREAGGRSATPWFEVGISDV